MRALPAAIVAAILSAVALGCGDGSEPAEPSTPTAPPGFFGVVPQAEIFEEDLDRMAAGKITTMRVVVAWGLIDPTPKPDDLNWAYLDPIVTGAAERGIRVVPTIYGTPAWVAEGLDGNECDTDCASYAPRSPEAIEAFGRFVGALADRYGPDGEVWADPAVEDQPFRSWQIWNEQNSPTFYMPEVDPEAYADMLDAAATEIRKVDPDAEVILGGMFGTPFKGEPPALSAWEFLEELYAIDGARDLFDAVASHPYAAHEGKIEAQVERLHEVIERVGDDASIWITEIGASSDEGDNPLTRGAEAQAALLREAFTFFVEQREELNIEGVTWYSWRDTTTAQCDWCAGSGLFEAESLTPKPAWEAFVAFTGGS
jgi:polysaccharide biosynthesis protein PslG